MFSISPSLLLLLLQLLLLIHPLYGIQVSVLPDSPAVTPSTATATGAPPPPPRGFLASCLSPAPLVVLLLVLMQEAMTAEAQRLAAASFGVLLLHTLGRMYSTQASIELGNLWSSTMGRISSTWTRIQSQIHAANSGLKAIHTA